MKAILEKKGFKLFFHNKETNKTLPVGWTGTSKGMLAKCKKLSQENEGSHFEYNFENGATTEASIIALTKLITEIYILETTNPSKIKFGPNIVDGKEINDCDPEPDQTEKAAVVPGISAEEAAKEIKPEQPKHIIDPHVVKHQSKSGHLFCSSKKCNNQIKIEGNLEYRHGTKIYLVCHECGHKTSVHKVEKTNSLSYAIGAENKGTLIRPDGPKKHMNKKSRLSIKRKEN